MKNDAIRIMMRKTKTILILVVLILASLAHLYAADTQCVWTGIEKIVAVGDIHGDYKAFIKILKGTGLIDKKLHWTGGKTHLVQIGDVLDRGDYAKEIFDLLMKLEKEAEEAGGKLHMLIGNHEELNITGLIFNREEFTTRQLVSFLPDGYREKQVKKFRKKIGNNPTKETGLDSSLDSDLMPFWEKMIKELRTNRKHQARREYIQNFNKIYGKWLLQRNAVIKINNIIFVHGGISEKFSKWELKKINNRLRVELEDLRRAAMNYTQPNIPEYQRQIVYDPNGPYWYRGFATNDQDNFKENVDRILKNLEAEYMVIAHTPRVIKTKEDMQLFQGRIWIIDTGISELYRIHMQGRLSALIINKGKFDVWGLNAVAKENAKQKELENYLRTAKIVSKRRTGGRGENWVISLDDGKIARRGFFKLLNQTRPTIITDSYKYGIAAYELDKLLDLNLVPTVVEREIESRKGSLQIFIEGALEESDRRMKNIKPPEPEKFKNTLEDLTVFENLIYSRAYCGERDLDDILIMDKKDWKIWRVDFSEAFTPSPELIPGCEITRCSKNLYQHLIKLEDKLIKAKLKQYLNDEEMSMLLKRKKLIIEKIKKLIAEKGEESVLFS